jgi:predicted alpha/beta-hydrolase family hydrolase
MSFKKIRAQRDQRRVMETAISRMLRCLLLLLITIGAARAEVINLPTRPGVTQSILFTEVAHPAASLILFPGALGRIGPKNNNFLIRVAPNFAASGFNVAIADTPSDQPSGMADGFRMSAAHADDIAAVIAFLRQRAAGPVWLVGTSRGTISAASIAAALGPPRVAGVVLTSTVWLSGIPSVPLEQIRVPTLVVHNQDDGCQSSPFTYAALGLNRLTAAPAKELIAVSGGSLRSGPCDALSQHGYYGIEDQVVPPIAAWIKAH